MVDARPRDPEQLIACTMIYDPKGPFRQGMGWGVAESRPAVFEHYPLRDPTCSYGPDGARDRNHEYPSFDF